MTDVTPPAADADRGYLSAASKRRFTIVAGVLGAVFFVAQMLLPFVLMLLVMGPMMVFRPMAIADLDAAALWRGDIWYVERHVQVDWRTPEKSRVTPALLRARVSDLAPAGPALPIEDGSDLPDIALLPAADRLWLIGRNASGYTDGRSIRWLAGAARPARASKPFLFEGRPAVLVLGSSPQLATLGEGGGRGEWATRDFPLNVAAQAGYLNAIEAVEADGLLYVFAETCTAQPDRCALAVRAAGQDDWTTIVEELCSCATWTAVARGKNPTVFGAEPRDKGGAHWLLEITGVGPVRLPLAVPSALDRWRPVSDGDRLILLAQGFPGSLKLVEVAPLGSPVAALHQARRSGDGFPFGPRRMMTVMSIAQALPVLLSLLLAFVLTVQMRRHRVATYEFEGRRVVFASLWRRALAQLVDAVPVIAGFVLAGVPFYRLMDDPAALAEQGRWFPLVFFALFAGAFVWALLVLLAYSAFEGRTGKTPGKWLTGIRVLGTDLRPCGFGRAVLRNLLTFVDGFFNFLVGVLLVAFTENWQRLGDFAARTIVVADDPAAVDPVRAA